MNYFHKAWECALRLPEAGTMLLLNITSFTASGKFASPEAQSLQATIVKLTEAVQIFISNLQGHV